VGEEPEAQVLLVARVVAAHQVLLPRQLRELEELLLST